MQYVFKHFIQMSMADFPQFAQHLPWNCSRYGTPTSRSLIAILQSRNITLNFKNCNKADQSSGVNKADQSSGVNKADQSSGVNKAD